MSDAIEERAELYAARIKARAEYPVVPMNRNANIPTKSGGKIKFRYADLSSIVSAVTPVLVKHGLAVTHEFDAGDMVTTLSHEGGAHVQSRMPMPRFGEDPKKWGAAVTYCRRYSLLCILGLVADEDHDATALEPEPEPEPKPAADPPAEGAATPTMLAVNKGFATLQLGPEEEERLCMKHGDDAEGLLNELREIARQRKKVHDA